MNPILLDWIGYIASLIILISLLMSSIKKLRWINLVGALIFGVYGFLIGSLPTGLMNIGIAVIDIYFLARIYLSKDYFTVLPIDDESTYLESFINFYKQDIEKAFDLDRIDPANAEFKLYVLRNMTPAAVFICHKEDDKTLEIRLDYAIPQYRDFKLGRHIFETQRDRFKERGFKRFIYRGDAASHRGYLAKMGFERTIIDDDVVYTKPI